MRCAERSSVEGSVDGELGAASLANLYAALAIAKVIFVEVEAQVASKRSRIGLQSLEPSMHVEEFVVVEAHQAVRGAQYCLAFGALEAVLIYAAVLV